MPEPLSVAWTSELSVPLDSALTLPSALFPAGAASAEPWCLPSGFHISLECPLSGTWIHKGNDV